MYLDGDGGLIGGDAADTAGNEPLRQQVTHYVAARPLQTLAEHMRAIVADDPSLGVFRGFVIYFSAKNLKAMFIQSAPALGQAAVDGAFHTTTANFTAHWEALIDERHLDPGQVYVDIGKQNAPNGTRIQGAELGQDGADWEPSTFLLRSCCLGTMCNEYRVWVDRFAKPRAEGRGECQGVQDSQGQDQDNQGQSSQG